tara:strand:+ start:44 stop:241 length:198 start_codon:yes stop_codon:yes gene_type:complete
MDVSSKQKQGVNRMNNKINYNQEILKLVGDLESQFNNLQESYKTILKDFAELTKKYNQAIKDLRK